MIIESLEVEYFRSILKETLSLENLTALVGANGTGKSSFLHALNLFYSSSPKIDIDDFYNRDTANPIIIAVTYKNLSEEAKKLFSKYLQNAKLTVIFYVIWDEGKPVLKYHGRQLQNPDFKSIRDGLEIKDRGATAKKEYETIRKNSKYSSLPTWTTIGDVQENLKQWEYNNPETCKHEIDDGQFFGFKGVGRGYLNKFTKFLFIPAVHDVSEDTIEGKGSIITELMNLVVRSVLSTKQEVINLKENTQKQYNEIMDPKNLIELNTLSNQMTNTLKTFVPDAEIDLSW